MRKLPVSTAPYFGRAFEYLRLISCKKIFKKCGVKVNVERNAYFGNGKYIEIGDWSSLGVNSRISNRVIIGKYVMMGNNVIILGANHRYSRTDIPMLMQGTWVYSPVIIEDDVWIGHNCIILPGRKIRKGSILAAGTVLTRNFPPYSIIAGNPGVLIKKRK